MLFKREILDQVKYAIFNNELDFYNKGLNIKELKEILNYYNKEKKVKNRNIEFIKNLIKSSVVETIWYFFILFIGIAIILIGVNKSNLNHYYLYDFFIVLFISFNVYNFLLKESIKFFFNGLAEEDKMLLLFYMKSLIKEKKILKLSKKIKSKKKRI